MQHNVTIYYDYGVTNIDAMLLKTKHFGAYVWNVFSVYSDRRTNRYKDRILRNIFKYLSQKTYTIQLNIYKKTFLKNIHCTMYKCTCLSKLEIAFTAKIIMTNVNAH